MAKRSEGWSLRQKFEGGVYLVRFRVNGRLVEKSTGQCSRPEARREAQKIVALAVAAAPSAPKRAKPGSAPLKERLGEWLDHLEAKGEHSPELIAIWENYTTAHWLMSQKTGEQRWTNCHDLTHDALKAYVDERLTMVQASTVRHEKTALDNFLEYINAPSRVPKIPKKAKGTKWHQRRRTTAGEMSPEEVELFIEKLPEFSTSKRVKPFPLKARFIVGYETGLRSSLLNRISVPEHYRKGQKYILITPDIDKTENGRTVPLTDRARATLDAVIAGREKPSGLLFGKHDYRHHLTKAAKAAFDPATAERFCGAHLRSARITHNLELTGDLPGTQYLAGHKLMSSTNHYVKASLRAATSVIAKLNELARKAAKDAGSKGAGAANG